MTKASKPASTQNREPPAYQEYATAMMARREYRLLSLAERGLLQAKLREAIESVIDTAEFNAQIDLEKQDSANIEAHRRVVFDAIVGAA